MVLDSDRFSTAESYHSEYKLDASLTIKNLRNSDFGSYRCISKNSLGETDGSIMLYELESTEEDEEEEEEENEVEQEEQFEHEIRTVPAQEGCTRIKNANGQFLLLTFFRVQYHVRKIPRRPRRGW